MIYSMTYFIFTAMHINPGHILDPIIANSYYVHLQNKYDIAKTSTLNISRG